MGVRKEFLQDRNGMRPRNNDGVTTAAACFVNFPECNNFLNFWASFFNWFCITFLGKTPSTIPSTSKKVITNKTVLPPVVVKQEFAHAKRPTNHNNNNIPSHLDVPKKLPSAKKSPPPEIKMENNGIKMEGKLTNATKIPFKKSESLRFFTKFLICTVCENR